jgi:hypothetical protein
MDFTTFCIVTLIGHSLLAIVGARLIWNKGYHPLWGVLLAGATGCIGLIVIGALPLRANNEIFLDGASDSGEE